MIYLHLLTTQNQITNSTESVADDAINSAVIADYRAENTMPYSTITGCVVGTVSGVTKCKNNKVNGSFCKLVWEAVQSAVASQGINVNTYVCGWRVRETLAELTVMSLKESQPVPGWAKTDLTKNYSTVDVLGVETLYHQNVYRRKQTTPELLMFLRDMGYPNYEQFICPNIDETPEQAFINLFQFFNKLLANYGYGHNYTN